MEQMYKYEPTDNGSEGYLSTANKKEFRRINELVSTYYNTKELPLTKWQRVRALKLSLSKTKVLQLNAIEDDRKKIKKINNGQGVELQPDIKKKDVEMELYRKKLNGIFQGSNKKDAFLRNKFSSYQLIEKNKENERIKKEEDKIKAALAQMSQEQRIHKMESKIGMNTLARLNSKKVSFDSLKVDNE